jgi:hypothetical protein
LGLRLSPGGGLGCCGGRACQLADGSEHYPPMPKQDADIFEILISQMGECRNINPVLGKTLGILGHAELFSEAVELKSTAVSFLLMLKADNSSCRQGLAGVLRRRCE